MTCTKCTMKFREEEKPNVRMTSTHCSVPGCNRPYWHGGENNIKVGMDAKQRAEWLGES